MCKYILSVWIVAELNNKIKSSYMKTEWIIAAICITSSSLTITIISMVLLNVRL